MPSEGTVRESPYRILGLEPRASREQIEKAYRFHIDLYADGALATSALLDPHEVERQRARVREAYELLRDPERRRAYDEGQGLPAAGSPVAPSFEPPLTRVAAAPPPRPAPPAPPPAPAPAPSAPAPASPVARRDVTFAEAAVASAEVGDRKAAGLLAPA
ncbi:MAG TPA: DnaJ domain-containing protein, partial [Vicinamibacteria bacterium]